MRKVTIITTQGSKTEFDTSATNWGALKSELEGRSIPTEGMKAVLGTTRTTLELNESSLPNEDFKVFLYPNKVKSGITSIGDLVDSDEEALGFYHAICLKVNAVIAEELGVTNLLNNINNTKAVITDPDLKEMEDIKNQLS